jgi:hypothetical protein
MGERSCALALSDLPSLSYSTARDFMLPRALRISCGLGNRRRVRVLRGATEEGELVPASRDREMGCGGRRDLTATRACTSDEAMAAVLESFVVTDDISGGDFCRTPAPFFCFAWEWREVGAWPGRSKLSNGLERGPSCG